MIASETGKKREDELFFLISTLSHEMTHSIQHKQGIIHFLKGSFKEKFICYKLGEAHAQLESRCVSSQMAEKKGRDIKYDTYTNLKNAKMAEGASETEADKFARGKWIEIFWGNTPDTPISVGGKPITVEHNRSLAWNLSYNSICFKRFREMDKRKRDAGIKKVLSKYVELMKLPLQPKFFLDEKNASFRLRNNRLEGYLNGIKNQEIIMLEAGLFEKTYVDGVVHAVHTTPQKKSKSQTEYYPNTRKKQVEYQICNGTFNGAFREYDMKGNLILEMSMKDGRPEGDVIQYINGKKVVVPFKQGVSLDIRSGRIRQLRQDERE